MSKQTKVVLVETWCEFSKPAQELIRTANRKGMNLDPWDHMDAYKVPFEVGFTRGEIREQLRDFCDNNSLTCATVLGGDIIELDSTNMSHAGAYFRVRVKVRKNEAAAAELV